MNFKILFISFILFLKGTVSYAQVVPLGAGSYNLTQPADQGNNVWRNIGSNRTDLITKGPNYTGPFQTHQWWNSALWHADLDPNGGLASPGDPNSDAMYAYPLILQAVPQGFVVRYRPRSLNNGPNQFINWIADVDLRVGLVGMNVNSTSVDRYGDWHATFRQDMGGGNVLLTTGARGCPYVYFEKQGNLDLQFYHNGAPGTIQAKSSSGNSIALYTQTGAAPGYTYGIFFPAGSTLGGTPINSLNLGQQWGLGSSFQGRLPAGSRYFAVCILPDNSQATLDYYEKYAFNFITGTNHTYNFNETQALLTTNFTVTTTPVYGGANTGTLQALFKHQWQNTTSAFTAYSYTTPKGQMRVVQSNTFSTQMTHNGILPGLGWANTADKTRLNNFVTTFMNGVNFPSPAADGYAKDEFEDLVTVAQIANQTKNNAALTKAINAMKSRLEDWFSAPAAEPANNNRRFVYSANFNWLAHYPNGFGSSGVFVDQHFHMGYLIFAAAVVAQFDPAWATQWGPMVELVIRQVDSWDKNDAMFPYLRYFDPYAGHSWAETHAYDQESVSEALHFAAGTFLWGITTRNKTYTDLGALLYITESVAGRTYWFDYEKNLNRGNMGSDYAHDHVGQIYAWGGTYATFFSGAPEWIHAITYIPMTAASTWMATDVAGAANEFSQIAGNYGSWGMVGQYINQMQAIYDPKAAIAAFNANQGSWYNSKKPFVYEWATTFDSCGIYVGHKIHADIPGYGVFQKDSCGTWYRHYMMYNPPGEPAKTVHFTDGTCWFLPQDTIITYALLGPDSTGPVTADKHAICVGESFKLNYHDFKVCDKDTTFEYQVSTDGTNWQRLYRVQSGGDSLTITLTPSQPGKYYYRVVMLNEYLKKPLMTCDLNDTGKVAMRDMVTVSSCGCDSVGKILLSTKKTCIGNTIAASTFGYVVTTADTIVEFQRSVDKKVWVPVQRVGPLNFAKDNNVSYTVTEAGWNYFRTVMINEPDPSCKNDTAKLSKAGQVDSILVTTGVFVEAGSDATICENISFTVLNSDSSNTNGTITWTTGGNGTFDNSGSLKPKYTPGSNDIAAGQVKLYLTGHSKGGCPDKTDSLLLKVAKKPSAIMSGSATVCSGSTSNISVALTGNLPWSVTYSDGSTSTTVTDIRISPYTFTGNAGKSYSVLSVSDSLCASGTPGGTAVISPYPAPTATVSGSKAICTGNMATVSIALTGTAPWNLTYSDGTNTTNVPNVVTNPYTFNTSNAGTYSVVSITDANTCQGTSSGNAVITSTAPPSATITNGNTFICPGSTANIDVVLTGAQPWNITYTDGISSQTVTGITVSPYSIPANSAGNYSVTSVGDATSCPGTASGTYTVSMLTPPTAVISGNQKLCSGDPAAPLAVTLTGSQPWSITYSDGVATQTVNNITASPYSLNSAVAGTYTVTTVIDATGCSASGSGQGTIVVNARPLGVISGSKVICPDGATTPLTIDLTGTAPFSITYTDGTNPVTVPVINSNKYTFNTSAAGTYQLTAVADANCTGTYSGSAVISNPVLPTASLNGSKQICPGSTADIDIVLTGAQPWSISYSDGSVVKSVTGVITSPYKLTTSDAGNYTITTVSDASTCMGTSSGSFSLSMYTPPTAVVSGSKSICQGDSPASLNVDLTGTPPWSLTYSDGNTTKTINNINATPYLISSDIRGSYSITAVTDATTCPGTFSGQGQIDVKPLPMATISGTAEICENTKAPVTISLTGTAPFSVTYTDGQNTATVNNISSTSYVINAGAGTYQITNISDAGCTGGFSGSAIITYKSDVKPVISKVNDLCNNAGTQKLNVTIPGGAWTGNGITNKSAGLFNPALAGEGSHKITYAVQGTCKMDSDTVVIKVLKAPSIPAQSEVSLCIGDTINLSQFGSYNFKWQDGVTTPFYVISVPGEYSVIVKDKVCSDTVKYVTDCPYKLYIPNTFTPNEDGRNDEFRAQGENIVDFEMFIFDRWGNKVFASSSMSRGWNGKTESGLDVPEDVYVYIVKGSAYNKNNRVVSLGKRVGHVVVIR